MKKTIIDEILELSNYERKINQVPGPRTIPKQIPVNNIIDLEIDKDNLLITYYDTDMKQVTDILPNEKDSYANIKKSMNNYHNPLVQGDMKKELFHLQKEGKVLGVKINEINNKKVQVLWAGKNGSYDYEDFTYNNSDEALAVKQIIIDECLLVPSGLPSDEYVDQLYFSPARIQALLVELLTQMKKLPLNQIVEIGKIGKQIFWKQRYLSIETKLFSFNTVTERDLVYSSLIVYLASNDLIADIKHED